MSTIWDLAEAEAARDEALSQVAAPAIAVIWSVAAYDALVAVARRQEHLTSDDVWAELEVMGITPPPERRAMGPIMVKAAKAGIVVHTGYVRGANPKHHANPHGGYRSLIR